MSFKFRLLNKNYVFQLSSLFLTFWVVMLLLMIALGFWQIKRYHFKLKLLHDYALNQQAASVPLISLDTNHDLLALQFKQVSLTGHYLNEQSIFVPTRLENNQEGFEVITPVSLFGRNEKLLLVDRGWINKTKLNPSLNITDVLGAQDITGSIKLQNEYRFILGPNILNHLGQKFIMQKIVFDELHKITGNDYYPFLLRLDKHEPNGFHRAWVITTVEPTRHLGYAVQWFVMSLVLCIAIISVGLRRI